jgi:PE-PPE domain
MTTTQRTVRVDARAEPGACNAGRAAVSIGAAVMAVTAAVLSPTSEVLPAVALSSDSTALIVCGTTCPTPDEFWVQSVKDQFIAPTHPGLDLDYVAVTTPQEFWPITGLFRLVGTALGAPEAWGPGGPGWPDQPWWKLSGLFDLTANQSLRAGADDLEAAMAAHGNDHLVINGYSQGAGVANVVKHRLAEQYPDGAEAPDIDFVLGGDPNLPNGGLVARFPGLYIPILDLTFNGPALTDTPFDTVEINRQYDGFSDFPLYPLNLLADLNAVLGILYLHTNPFDVSLPADPTTSPAYQGSHGDTTYYFFETDDLPLFAPLRSLGVPESLIDIVEPFVKVIVDLGYDRSIPPWEPTPARLIPSLDMATMATDLVNATGEGITNALAAVGVPSQPKPPALSPSESAADIADEAPSTDIATPSASSTAPESTPSRTSSRRSPADLVSETATRTTPSAPDATQRSATTTADPSTAESTKKSAKAAEQSRRDPVSVNRPDRSERGESKKPTTRADAEKTTDSSSAGASTATDS